ASHSFTYGLLITHTYVSLASPRASRLACPQASCAPSSISRHNFVTPPRMQRTAACRAHCTTTGRLVRSSLKSLELSLSLTPTASSSCRLSNTASRASRPCLTTTWTLQAPARSQTCYYRRCLRLCSFPLRA